MTWELWGSSVDCAGDQHPGCKKPTGMQWALLAGAGLPGRAVGLWGQGDRGQGGSPYASHREAGSSHLGEKMSRPHLFAVHVTPCVIRGGLLYELRTE